MTSVPLDTWESRALDAAGNDRLVRSVLFLVTFLMIWVTARPFPDLSNTKAFESAAGGNPLGQVLVVLLTGALAVFAYTHRTRLVVKAVTPILVFTFLWFACSAAFSLYPALAARRVVLAVFVIFQAAVFLLLPQDRTHFARLLAAGSLVVLFLCYAGVVFAPEHSVHQASDIAEPQLAGNWRGFFAHKNGAGAGMGLLIIIGIYVFRASSMVLGSLIVALAAVFLVFTESKSPLTLLPLAFIVGVVFVRLRRPAAKAIIAASVPAVIGVLTIGSVEFDAIHALVGKLLSDPTFTGRNDIWEFTLAHIAQRPIVGFGYQAFWRTSELVNNWTWLESWGYRASDAHNGYLDIAVTTGLVGLVLALGWVLVQPILDQIRSSATRVDPALNMMFVQTWLFALYLSGFESELFSNGSIVWFMAAVSIIGMRFQATTEYIAEPA
jgi:O-antigen ligase